MDALCCRRAAADVSRLSSVHFFHTFRVSTSDVEQRTATSLNVSNGALCLSDGLRSTVSAEQSCNAQQTTVQVDYFLKYSDFILVIARNYKLYFFHKISQLLQISENTDGMSYIFNVHKVLDMSRNLAQTSEILQSRGLLIN